MAAVLTTHRRRGPIRAVIAAVVLTMSVPANAMAYNTVSPSFVASTGAIPGVEFVPLINSGETAFGDLFEGIPDGIGVLPEKGGHPTYVDLFVNHEQSRVPFPLVGGSADFNDSSVTRVRVDVATQSIIDMEVALPSSAGFIRFCSSTLVNKMGFKNPTLFTNEESNDPLVVPAGAAYPADAFYAPNNYRQAGYTVALDTVTGAITPIAGMGRHNHENQVLVPGWGDTFAFLSGDDTFAAPGSQLYLYLAGSSKKVLSDQGHLYGFQVTGKNGNSVNPADPQNGANDYLDVSIGDDLSGRFIQVPDDVARGTTSANPQDALEAWSNSNNVFQFVRVEDIAYDPDSQRTVYFADTGSTRIKADGSGRLFRPANLTVNKPWSNSDGRIFKMVMNASDPTVVDSLTILGEGALTTSNADGSTSVVNAGVGILQPDNVAVSHSSLMVQEDNGTAPLNNDVWLYALSGGTWTKIASATQTTTAETSGIVDVSAWFGAGWWALDVQSHINLAGEVPNQIYPGPGPANGVTYTQRRELGQLLLMYVPGS